MVFLRRYFLFVLPLFIFSCKPKNESIEKQTFHLNLAGGLESLDPAFSKDLSTMWTAHMLYNTLVETNEQLQITPSLAYRWDISADGLTYTFHLRPNVFFQDNERFPNGKGRRMTASDVVYSFSRLIDPEVASPGGWIFNDRVLEKNPFTAPDDSTFQLHLARPFRPMLPILSMPYCSVVPKEVAGYWKKNFRRHPCGTGPFQYTVWDEGNVLILHRNKHYWERDSAGNQLPFLQAVQVSFTDNKATEFLLFLQKKLQFVNGVDGSFKDLVLTKNGALKPEFARQYQLKKGVYLNTEYLGINLESAQKTSWANPLVRQAVNYAIDRKKIVTYFKNGIGIPANYGFTPPGMAGFDAPPDYGFAYDPQKALSLLAEAGFPNGRGLQTITILTPDNFADIVNFVASQLAETGIPVKVEIMQPGILREQMTKGTALAFRAQWIADYPDAETFLTIFNGRLPAPPNYTRFKNKTFDALYDQSMNAPDSIRWKLYRQMDSIAISAAPLIPIYYDQRLHFLQKNISGLQSNPMNLIDLKKVKMSE